MKVISTKHRMAMKSAALIIKNEETNTGDKVRFKWTVKPRWYSDKQQMFYCWRNYLL